MSIFMCKWAEPEDDEEEETPKDEDQSGRKKTRSSQRESPSPPQEKSPSKSPEPVNENSPLGSKRSTPEKEPEKDKPGPIFSLIKWADNDIKEDDQEEEDSGTLDDHQETADQSQDEDANKKEDEDKETVDEIDDDAGNEEDDSKKDEEKPSIFFSVKWADSTNEAEESEKEEEAPSIPAEWLSISSSILGEIEQKEKKEPEPVQPKEEILQVKEEPVDQVDEKKQGAILNIRWADDPGNEVPESPPRSTTPPSPSVSPSPMPSDNNEEKSSRASSVDTTSDRGKQKGPKCGPKSAMMKYRSRNSSGTSDTSSKSSTKRKLTLAGPKSATKKIKEENESSSMAGDNKSKRLRCPSQKLLEWTKITGNTKLKSKKGAKEAKTSSDPATVRVKQEPIDADTRPLSSRLKRKARPSTFNQNFNTDPNSPYLYNSSRSKGPMVRLECDLDEDHDDNYVPELHHSTDESESDHEIDGSSKKRSKQGSSGRKSTNASATSTLSKRRASTRKVKMEPEVVLEEIMAVSNDTGLSLGSVYSLADEEIVIDAEPETEPFLQLDLPDLGDIYGGSHHHEDPLFDPLSSSSSYSFLRKRPSFTWPKLDPLFLIMTHYQLPSSFDPLIRARVTPTAKIYPMQNLKSPGVKGFDGMDGSVSISKVISSSSSIGTRSTPSSSGIRRSGRKKAGRYEMKNLFEGTILDTPYSLPVSTSTNRRSQTKLASTPSSKPTPSTPTKTGDSPEDLAARLSRYSGSSITITPYKDSPANKANRRAAAEASHSVQTRVVPLDRKDFPWLPRDWKVHATVDTDGVVMHSFISPSGVSLNSQSAVMQFLRSTDPKTYQAAMKQQATASRKRICAKVDRMASRANPAMYDARKKQNSSSKKQKYEAAVSTSSSPAPKKNVKKKVDSKDEVIVSDIKPVIREPYEILCKSGDFSCPLCSTKFKLNQTYGRHVVAKKCKQQEKNKVAPPMRVPNKSTPWILEEEDVDEEPVTAKTASVEKDDDLEVLQANVTPASLNHVKVQNCTVKDDSYVDISSVPSLKLLARGKQATGGLIKVPISVKEGLEYYHSIVWKENNENTYFEELVAKTKLTMCSTVGAYEELCKEPLKVALFLERKISISREKFGHRALRTKNWVQKYERFLKLPIQDIYLSIQGQTYKVIEHYCNGEVKPMCLNCSVALCTGCALVRPPPPKTSQQTPSKKIAVPIRVKNTGANRGTPPANMARCGICPGCMQPNCRRCIFCRDMKRYGGPARLKRACQKRVCAQISSSPLATVGSTTVMKSNPVASRIVADGIRTISQPSNNSGRAVIGSSTTPRPPSGGASVVSGGGRTTITTITPSAAQSKSYTRIPREKSPSPVTIDLDDPASIQQAIQSSGRSGGAAANVSKESYPCTVCKRLFPTRIQMLAHRSVSHDKTNIVASVNRPVVLHHGGEHH